MMAQQGSAQVPGRRSRRGSAAIAGLAALLATLAASTPAAVEPVRLLSVTAQGPAVVIEATDPVAYTVNRPDAVTLVVDLRNAVVADAVTRIEPRGPVTAVRLEQTKAADGLGVARVRIALGRAAEYRVKSSRNSIRVELTAGAAPAAPKADLATKTDAPVTPPVAPKASAPVTPPVAPKASAPVMQPVVAKTTVPAATVAPVEAKRESKPAAVPAPRPAPSVTPAVPIASAESAPVLPGVATTIERVRTSRQGTSTVVTISGDGKLSPNGVSESRDLPRRLIIDFPNVASRAAAQTAGDGELVRKVRVGLNTSTPLVTRVVMEISDGAAYDVRRNSPTDRELTVVFKGPAAAATAAGTAGPPSEARSREDAAMAMLGAETISLEQAIANGAALTPRDEVLPGGAMAALKIRPQNVAPAAARQSPAPAQPPAAPPAEPPAATSPVIQGPQSLQISSGDVKKYVGHPISMDFQGVDLRSVLRTFAEISGLNMVIDPDVQGTVDIVLTDVPWDQALEVILRGNALDYTVDGTIVRIARIETLRKEQDARTQLAQSAANAGALAVRTYTLSYAKADQAAPLVKSSVLSPRGNVQIDARTNTLIITDLPMRLDTVQQLLGTIDRAEPQVEIEARIITTTRDYARALGLQWGFNGRVDSTIGNTTGLTFPNNGSLGGRLGNQGPIGTDPRAGANERTGTAVDLPFVSDFPPTSAIGLALGSINGALNLDVALSALERTGKGRILSTPRVTTQNNVDAEITQGVQIPIQVEANNTVTTTYKDAALTLKVTPQITAANTVIMQITLENSAPGAQTPDGGLSIDTQRAITRVQVNDGMTTVIGGIFVSREQTVNSRTPLLYRIPFLGWLFKNDSQTDTSRELLIFITPRIQKG
jgi:type IV pilus assembly protein PilQ